MKLISIVTPCYNEEENVEEIYAQVRNILAGYPKYAYEHIFIDNCSTDQTVLKLRVLARKDPRVKLILNTRNFCPVRSPYYGLLQANGDAVVYLVADLQDPPELIREFIRKWEEGFKVVVGVKPKSEELYLFAATRRLYYRVASAISDIKLIQNFTGFGLFDRALLDVLRKLDDPYPYFRGLISEVGFPVAQIPYIQPKRKRGFSKANFYILYDWAMLGITSHSKLPIRMATMGGFFLSALSFILSISYFFLKVLYWKSFALGVAPVLIGVFFFASVQLLFIGILGEYVAAIHTRIMKRPLVVEAERVNFNPRNGEDESICDRDSQIRATDGLSSQELSCGSRPFDR